MVHIGYESPKRLVKEFLMQLTKKLVLQNFVFFSSKIGRKPSQPLTGNTDSIWRSLRRGSAMQITWPYEVCKSKSNQLACVVVIGTSRHYD